MEGSGHDETTEIGRGRHRLYRPGPRRGVAAARRAGGRRGRLDSGARPGSGASAGTSSVLPDPGRPAGRPGCPGRSPDLAQSSAFQPVPAGHGRGQAPDLREAAGPDQPGDRRTGPAGPDIARGHCGQLQHPLLSPLSGVSAADSGRGDRQGLPRHRLVLAGLAIPRQRFPTGACWKNRAARSGRSPTSVHTGSTWPPG